MIEVLIAITLVAMMAVGLWAVFRISIVSWARGAASIDATQRHRSILDLVKKQMGSIYGLVAPVDLETGGAIYPIFAGADHSVQFISLSSLRFQENPGLTMVSYDVVRDDERGAYQLVEREEQYLGLDPSRESFLERKDQRVVTIFEDLVSLAFEYYDPGDAEHPAQWMQEWSAKDTGRLPSAISITMIARDERGGTFNRHVVVPVFAKPYDPRLNFMNPFESRPRRLREDDPRALR